MRMLAPADACTGVTIEGGKEYTPDKDGIVTVDNPVHEKVLRRHGYVPAEGGVLSLAGRKGRQPAPPPADDDDDQDDEFDAMTKGELIEWLEGQKDFDDDDIPAKPKLGQLQKLAREHKAKSAS